MDVIAANLANADTTQGANGQPYRRQEVVLQEASPSFGEVLGGVQVAGIVDDPEPADDGSTTRATRTPTSRAT